MIYHKNFEWDANYDVVVLGFGGAGATAARFAADHDAKVLLVDSAPEGHEGGNTRYSAQLIGTGNDFNELKKYYQKLTAPMELDEDMIDTYVEGMVNTPQYVSQYLGVKPNSAKEYAPIKVMLSENFLSLRVQSLMTLPLSLNIGLTLLYGKF